MGKSRNRGDIVPVSPRFRLSRLCDKLAVIIYHLMVTVLPPPVDSRHHHRDIVTCCNRIS